MRLIYAAAAAAAEAAAAEVALAAAVKFDVSMATKYMSKLSSNRTGQNSRFNGNGNPDQMVTTCQYNPIAAIATMVCVRRGVAWSGVECVQCYNDASIKWMKLMMRGRTALKTPVLES